MGAGNTGYEIGRSSTGGAMTYRADYPQSFGSLIAGGSAGAPATSTGVSLFELDGSGESQALQFAVPGEFDDTADELVVRVLAAVDTAGNASSLDIDAVKAMRAGESAAVDLLDGASITETVSSTTPAMYELSLASLGVKANDGLTITLGCTIDTSHIFVYGIWLRIRRNAALTNRDDRE